MYYSQENTCDELLKIGDIVRIMGGMTSFADQPDLNVDQLLGQLDKSIHVLHKTSFISVHSLKKLAPSFDLLLYDQMVKKCIHL